MIENIYSVNAIIEQIAKVLNACAYIMVKPNFKGINRDINVIYALGHYNIPLMFDIEPVAPFNTINLLLSMA